MSCALSNMLSIHGTARRPPVLTPVLTLMHALDQFLLMLVFADVC
jgi:hypothetical protein